MRLSYETGNNKEIEYEIDNEKLAKILIAEFSKEFYIDIDVARTIILEFDLDDELKERYEEEIKDYCEKEFWEWYQEFKGGKYCD
jgi:hypothetical protein